MIRRSVTATVIVLFLVLSTSNYIEAYEDDAGVVSLGEDLTNEQRNEMLEIFGANEDTKVIYVTNEEEKEYLSSYIKEEVIGSRALSSAYVIRLKDNQGIKVETYNITWVTKEMYMNALATAGVANAKIKVASPIEVSGTAALTGIIKAFEDVSGEKIGEKEKQVANEEIAKTGQLAKDIGKDRASHLVKEIKEEIIDKNIKDIEQIRRTIVEISGEFNIKLNEQQINDIVSLMKNISRLNLNLENIQGQLRGFTDEIKEVTKENKEVKSILQRIMDFFKRILQGLFSWLGDVL